MTAENQAKNARELVNEARKLDYSSIVSKLAGKELTYKQKQDYENYKMQYNEATELREQK